MRTLYNLKNQIQNNQTLNLKDFDLLFNPSCNKLKNIFKIFKTDFFEKHINESNINDFSASRNLPKTEGIIVAQGIYNKSAYNLVSVDLSKNDFLVYLAPQDQNRKFQTRSLDELAKQKDAQVIINGTFFNVDADNQPLGILIYGAGKYTWNPATYTYDKIPVVSLNRYFLALNEDGKPFIDRSYGNKAEYFRNRGIKELIGGCGPLVWDGKVIVSPESLEEAHFRPPSHQMNHKRQRSALGIDNQGKLILAAFGNQADDESGLTLKELAEFMLNNGAVQALFLDSGSSTGMYLSDDGTNLTGIPRAQPTYILIKSGKNPK
ncbi:MAG: phosphodiester glycosidase family protein [Armatimonadetes bacterium]|nr:phosphodiester glycosidase family protein [Armatimonadota bacterium]